MKITESQERINHSYMGHVITPRVHVDTIELWLKQPLRVDEVLANAKLNDFKINRDVRLRDGKHYLQCSHEAKGIKAYFRYSYDRMTIYKIKCSVGIPINTFIPDILSLLCPINISNIRISRLDISIDYPTHFIQIWQGADVARKRSITQHSLSGEPTGAEIGSENEKFVFYNKAKQLRLRVNELSPKLEDGWTRIELRLFKQNLPVKGIVELVRDFADLESSRLLKPFQKISLYKIQMVMPESPSEKDFENYYRLKSSIEAFGFTEARRRLNKHNNFHRRYSKYYSKALISPQPYDFICESSEAIHQLVGGTNHDA